MNSNSNNNHPWRSNRGNVIAMGLIALVALLILSLVTTITWTTVEGDEVAVKETWDEGVINQFFPAKTYLHNRWTTNFITYKTSGRVFVMNDKIDKDEPFAEGRRMDPLEIVSLDNQKVQFHIILTWRIDPNHVVNLHKSYRDHIEERLIRPEVVREIGTRATIQAAIDIYSGPKLNDLRKDAEAALKNPNGKMSNSGIIVDSLVIERPTFPNKAYVEAIEARQLAMITKSKAEEQEKANESEAKAAKALAQVDANKRIVAQEAQKKIDVLKQEAESEMNTIKAKADALNSITAQEAESKKIVLQATADAEKIIAASKANRDAELNRALGIEAVGKAEAEAQKLRLSAYSVPGSDLYTRVEVSKNFGAAIQGVRFYPANATFNTIAGDFEKGLSLLVGAK